MPSGLPRTAYVNDQTSSKNSASFVSQFPYPFFPPKSLPVSALSVARKSVLARLVGLEGVSTALKRRL